MKDVDIIRLLWQREEAGILELQQKYQNYCHTIARNILPDTSDVEECVSDTWLKAWTSIPPNRPESLKLFLARVSRNLALNKLRYARAEKRGGGQIPSVLDELSECISQGTCMDEELERRELQGIVKDFVEKLPDRERNVFLRRYFFADSISSIAERYALTENHIGVILSRVRAKLKKRLSKEGYL